MPFSQVISSSATPPPLVNTLLTTSNASSIESNIRNKLPVDNNDSSRSKTPKERRSVSPKIRSPSVSASSTSRSSNLDSHQSSQQTTASSIPSEQRLPSACISSFATSQPSNSNLTGPHLTSHGFPYPHMIPPGLHPYFPAPPPSPHWYAVARGMQPGPPLAFGPHSVSSHLTHHHQPSHSPMNSSKPKSPVTSHASRVTSSPSSLYFTGLNPPPPSSSLFSSSSSSSSSSSLKHDNRNESYQSTSDRSSDSKAERIETQPAEEEDIELPSAVTRGPTPPAVIEDKEFHRSHAAIFLRHWNRGDFNSCARTDLTFKPVPDSPLARKREERARKAAEKEREEQKVQQIKTN